MGQRSCGRSNMFYLNYFDMTTTTYSTPDLSREVHTVLSAVSELEGKYGQSYLIDFLRGTTRFGVRDEGHPALEQFGAMVDGTPDYVRRMIQALIREGYLLITNKRFGTIGLTESGRSHLENPDSPGITARMMRESAFIREVRRHLKRLRSDLAKDSNLPPFRVFTNYCMEEMIQRKPTSVSELLEIPGIGPYKANLYGPAILGCFADVSKMMATYYEEQRKKKAATPSHQQVKALFEQGHTVEEIAEIRQVKSSTISRTLDTLHRVGEIDLRPYIRESVPTAAFEQATSWFLQREEPQLKQAYEELGLDYDTLRLCKLYVADLASSEVELAKAS